MQELEKERIRSERAAGGVAEEAQDRPNIKFMISGEAPILMSKACELLIKDLSFRAWQHTERNRRRTLQRQDLHAAVGESEVYDFLIDIVPRVQAAQGQATAPAAATTMDPAGLAMMQGAVPQAFQMPQMAAAMNPAAMQQTMQQTAQVMAAALPGPAPPAQQQQAPAPGGIDPSGANPQGGMIQFAHSTSTTTDALNHLANWEPTQVSFQHHGTHDGSEGHQTSTPNPFHGGALPPPPHQQQPQQQQQQQQQQPQHQHQQQQQHVQLQLHPPNPQQQQWMDPANIAGMGTAPSAQQTPGA